MREPGNKLVCSGSGGSFDLFTLRFRGTHEVTEPFAFTTGRWYNKLREDGDFAKAPAYREGFTYADFAYGTDTPEHFAPEGAPLQVSLICSPAAQFLAIDVDYPENLPGSATGALVSWSDAISVRGSHFHVGVDMRGVAAEEWPVQGRTAWGDVKAAGFIPLPGSLHKSGEPYAATGSAPLAATPELLKALRADRDEHALRRLNAARQALGLAAGTRLPDGTYLYASGYAGGSWRELPDGALAHDDELKDLVHDMHVEYGVEEAEVRAQWYRLARALGKPWTERDFERHWHRVPSHRARRLENDDALRFEQDFGLRLPPLPEDAEEQRQRRDYQQRAQGAAGGFGPPTPVPPGGFEAHGINYLPRWLRTRPADQNADFDAGYPTDADNALEVLLRAQDVLRLDDESGSWLLRDTGRWRLDDNGPQAVIMELRGKLPADRSADPLKDPRYENLDPEADAGVIAALKRNAKNAERLSNAGTVAAVGRMMTAVAVQYRQAGGTLRPGTLDADPEVLWAGGVPWDLRASYHGPAPAAVPANTPHLHEAAVVPDASVPTPLWDDLLDAVWPPEKDRDGKLRRDMQEWALLALSAGVTGYPKKVIPVLKGGTDRGKSTVIDAIADVLGTYFGPLNPKILDAGTSTHDTVLMELKGRRLTFLDESVKRGAMATTRLKRLAGGSAITANRMRQDPVTFKPTHTLVITLNPDDSFSFDDPAVDSRIRLLPCNGNPADVIAVARRFNYYSSPEWLAERPGVLAKLMRAAAVLLADDQALAKDRAPMTVQVAEQAVKDEEDDVLRWFLEATTDCPEGFPSRELFISFREWTRETKGDRGFIPSETKWGLRMNELVPDDVSHTLYTRNKSRLRRRKPLQPGAGGFGGSNGLPTAAEFMRGGEGRLPSGKLLHPPANSVPDTPEGYTPPDSDPPARPNPPANPPDAKSQVSAVVPVGTVGTVGIPLPPTTNTTTPPTYDWNGTGETHRPTDPPAGPPAGPPTAGLQSDFRLENGEKPQNAQNGNSPPEPKTRKTKMTPQERAERDAAKKAKLAQARADARTAKIAELGGKPVQLPAIVLRDQRIIETDAATARTWLEPALDELSVDVEHSGYQLGHADYALRLVQLGNEGSAVVFDPSDPAQAEVIKRAMAAARVLHAHSAHADLVPLEHAGLGDRSMWDRMRDTVHLAKLTDPALCDSDEAALKPLARALLGDSYALSWRCDEVRKELFAAGGWIGDLEADTPVERSGWANVPVCEAFTRYAASDVMDCAAVWRELTERGRR